MDPIIKSILIGSDVLDIGCGRGMVLLNLAAAGRIRSGVGVEIPEQLVAEANAAKANCERILGHELDIEFIYREPEQIFDFDQHFDVVMTVDVLHHVPVKHQSDFIRSLMARVKDGGTLVYKDMCQKPFWRATGNRMHDLLIAGQWINYFPMEESLSIINCDPEWQEPSLDTYSRLWYGHELAVAKKKSSDPE